MDKTDTQDKIDTQKIPDGKIKISINIPEKLVNEVDFVRGKAENRSNWISIAVMKRLAETKELI